MEKILISACFLGEKVRYDGLSKTLSNPFIHLWRQQKRLVVICPEVAGGLPVPRNPAELQQNTDRAITEYGFDVSHHFSSGAQQALALCKKHSIKFALLKESSPSCGSTWVYDGNFVNKKIAGQGITCQLLRQHDIKVFSENTIELLAEALKVTM
jgi:uncharacterized protein YbbK (DUF523 family)